MSERILIIDDDPTVRDIVRGSLEHDGYAVATAEDGAEGLRLGASLAPALIVLDLRLPDMSGETVLQEVRRRSAVPVLVLSGKGRVDDRVHGLGLGADDYLVKPFSPIELLARIKAILRRAPREAPKRDLLVLDEGRLEIDTLRREVRVDGELRDMTPTEFELLVALAERAGQVQSRATIAQRLRGDTFGGDERLVDVHIRNLRRKIEDDPTRPRRVETIRGGGYRIALEPA
jgi:DNA-binding response OmpR family regulator